MFYKNQEEVKRRAEEYIMSLRSAGFSAKLRQESFRDYSVKVSISKETQHLGDVIIYYSPKKDSYKLGTHELKDQSVKSDLEDIWFEKKTSSDGGVENKATGWQIYVDGSWIDGNIGYGVVILKDDQLIHEIAEPIENSDQDLQNIRQVAGELQAVQDAINWLTENGAIHAEIYYDYNGIEKWATGEWQAKNPITQGYRHFIRECTIEITWKKVEGHTGNRWNERADQLAKVGANKLRQPLLDATDPIAELDEIVHKYVQLLVANEIQAEYRGIMNQQFARIVISRTHPLLRDNIVDIYNTKKKRLSPTWHDFPNEELKERAKALWEELIHPENTVVVSTSSRASFDHVDYYFNILKPFRDFEFDFINLAEVLQQALKAAGKGDIDVDEIRYDFTKLERKREELKEHMDE